MDAWQAGWQACGPGCAADEWFRASLDYAGGLLDAAGGTFTRAFGLAPTSETHSRGLPGSRGHSAWKADHSYESWAPGSDDGTALSYSEHLLTYSYEDGR